MVRPAFQKDAFDQSQVAISANYHCLQAGIPVRPVKLSACRECEEYPVLCFKDDRRCMRCTAKIAEVLPGGWEAEGD